MCETKNDVVNSEAETSSGALQSEREACVVSEMKNNAVKSEAQPSVDVNHKKTNAVDSEAELSVKGGLSVESEGSNQGDEDSRPASDALDGQNVGTGSHQIYLTNSSSGCLVSLPSRPHQ